MSENDENHKPDMGEDGGGRAGHAKTIVCAVIITILVVGVIAVCGWTAIDNLIHPPVSGPAVNLGMGV